MVTGVLWLTAVRGMEPSPTWECGERVCNFPQSGVVFIKEREMTLSGDVWTIASNIDVGGYEGYVNSVFKVVTDLANNQVIRTFSGDEINRLRIRVENLVDRLSSISLLTMSGSEGRQKRGLLDAVGSGMKFLFGTMDNSDLLTLNTHINALASLAEDTIHLEKEQLSYVKQLQGEVRLSEQNTKTLAAIMDENLGRFSNLLQGVEEKITYVNASIVRGAKTSSLLRSIEFAISTIDNELLRVQQALDTLAQGKISSLIVTPRRLLSLLNEVVLKLPEGLSLIISPEISLVHLYYSLCKAYAVGYNSGIRVIFEIPLKSVNRHFSVFKIISLPVFERELQRYVELSDIGEYIAVSEDQQRHLVITGEFLRRCTTGRSAVCPPDLPVHLKPGNTCEAALFREQEGAVPATCNRKIYLGAVEAQLYRVATKGSWVFSTSNKITITLECPSQPQPVVLSILGAGVITRSAGCHVHASDFVLYPVTKGYMQFDGQTEFRIPPMPSMLSPEEHHSLTTYHTKASRYLGMTALHEIINSTRHPGTSYAPLQLLLRETELQYNKWDRSTLHNRLAMGGCITASITAVIALIAWKHTSIRGCWQSKSHHVAVIGKERQEPITLNQVTQGTPDNEEGQRFQADTVLTFP